MNWENGEWSKRDRKHEDVRWIQQKIQTQQWDTWLFHDFLHLLPSFLPQIPCMHISSLLWSQFIHTYLKFWFLSSSSSTCYIKFWFFYLHHHSPLPFVVSYMSLSLKSLPLRVLFDWKVLYWLSGLTCTDENFIIKSGAQRAASTHGIALVVPDTSPSKPHSFTFVFVNSLWAFVSF